MKKILILSLVGLLLTGYGMAKAKNMGEPLSIRVRRWVIPSGT